MLTSTNSRVMVRIVIAATLIVATVLTQQVHHICTHQVEPPDDVRLVVKRSTKSIGYVKPQFVARPQDKPEINSHNPVVFVPGIFGSQLEARLRRTAHVRPWCPLRTNWFDIYLNVRLLTPLLLDCFVDDLRLLYNGTSRMTHSTLGVEIRAKSFGKLESVSYLSGRHEPETEYFESLVATLARQNGLKRDVNMAGAAYDFRKPPHEMSEYFDDLGKLIESLWTQNQNRSVTMICHSLGCLMSVHMLNKKPREWRNKYVRRLVSMAGPYAGAFRALKGTLVGDDGDFIPLDSKKLQVLEASFPSLFYLFPREPTFSRDYVLVSTPERNYSLATLDKLFEVARMPDQARMYLDSKKIAESLRAPEVELWCVYGYNVPTAQRLNFLSRVTNATRLVDLPAVQTMGDGDHFVNLASLRECETFALQQEQPVYLRAFRGIDHLTLLRRQEVMQFISSRVLAGDLPHRAMTTWPSGRSRGCARRH